MKHLLLCFWFATLGCCRYATAQRSNENSTAPNTYALIIGITNYQNPAIPALQFADKDARQFAAWLQSKAGGEVALNNIQLLLNQEATIAAIYNALDWLKAQCKENDNAYIYFAGHGDVETKNNYSKGYLLAYNSPQNNYANNAVRIEDFNNISIELTTKNKAKVIIISDACHSGTLAGDFHKGKQLVAGELTRVLNDQVRIASSREDELSAEGVNWGGGRGVFSYYLILGLQGLAAIQNNKTIPLSDLSKYLETSFASDKILNREQHAQHPVSDGNPNFTMATIDTATLDQVRNAINNGQSASTTLPIGLMALKPLQPQPIDVFFSTISSIAIESIINFDEFKTLDASTFPLKMTAECIRYQNNLHLERDTSQTLEFPYEAYDVFSLDTLNLLSRELQQNSSTNKRFVEKFIQMVHEKGQEMINAYLKGDLSELEKRQYYYSGERDYRKHISMLQVALKFVSPDHQLSRILQVHYYYLSGLIDRLQMATQTNTDSLLNRAFANQRQALQLEQYAAYILNELGNLHLHKNHYDSSGYYFNLATVVAPTWAIPWSNKIRMNLALDRIGAAEKDIHTADSLQPNLAFVLINAGLVMEKKKNLLAAESYYLRAIKENDVHYLPYERLSNIYLNKGDFKEANYFFYKTEERKKDFAVNDKNFKYGVELGGLIWNETQNEFSGCPSELPQNSTYALYFKLYKILSNVDTSEQEETIIDSLQNIIHQKPDIPLAFHALGKLYFRQGHWDLAEQALEKALAGYLPNDRLVQKITKDIVGKEAAANDTCSFRPFLNVQYDIREDRFMLADLYERKGQFEKAFSQYQLISLLENKRQLVQAGYTNYDSLVKSYEGSPFLLNEYITKATENPIIMAGAIKAGRLYEKLENYKAAEAMLLQQVALSRKAGDERQKAIDEKRPGWNANGLGIINFFWLAVNSYLECEVYNFYQRMLMRFPRDGYWQKNAGFFLFNRLKLAFDQVPVKQYLSFYESMSQYAYPWKAAVEQNEDYRFFVPGTGEKLDILSAAYDPLKTALDAIILSIRFSGNTKPDTESAIALAELYSWMGNINQSTHWYQQSLNLSPKNWKLRSEFSHYLTENAYLPEACAQLQVMYQQNRTTQKQSIQLADWLFLSGKSEQLPQYLQKIKPKNPEEARSIMWVKARYYSLRGEHAVALRYYKDSIPEQHINETDDYTLAEEKKYKNGIRLFAIARQYALLTKYDMAFEMLQQALDAGFKYEYLLRYDTAWDHFRNNNQWEQLLSNYTFELEEPNTEINPISYRIPQSSAKEH